MKEREASSTAFTVLQGMVYISNHSSLTRLVSPDQKAACQMFMEETEEGRRRLKQLNNRLFISAVPFIENMFSPGLMLHYALRKRFIEEECISALKGGYSQVVNIGAGFDTLSWRLHSRFQDVNFMEIDHPATSTVKQQIVKEKQTNLSLMSVDLSKNSLVQVLLKHEGFDPDRKTFYICEGVLIYLEPDSVREVFESLKRVSKTSVRFAFTAMSPIGSPTNNMRLLLNLYLRVNSEPFAWSLELSEVETFVNSLGYRLLDTAVDQQLIFNYTPNCKPRTIHRGEFVAVAELNTTT